MSEPTGVTAGPGWQDLVGWLLAIVGGLLGVAGGIIAWSFRWIPGTVSRLVKDQAALGTTVGQHETAIAEIKAAARDGKIPERMAVVETKIDGIHGNVERILEAVEDLRRRPPAA